MEKLNVINNLTNVVSQNQNSVCVFTTYERYLKNLTLSDDGISKSGIWKLNLTRMSGVSKVVVYYRHNNINEIIVGNYLDKSLSNYPHRYFIHFKITNRCQTLNNWKVFCNTGTNPVRYYP
jgi:hypothetical protein